MSLLVGPALSSGLLALAFVAAVAVGALLAARLRL
jgi:hypothetical protein